MEQFKEQKKDWGRFGGYDYYRYIRSLNQYITMMKTMDINENVSLKLDDRTERIMVSIDSETNEVVDCLSEFTPMSLEDVQNLVNKLIRFGMITVDKNISNEDGIVDVSILIWNIDETDDLYIETYHIHHRISDNELFDDYDRTMKYDKFV